MLNTDDMSNEEYVEYLRKKRKTKQLNKQLKENQKAMQGFGYTYKPVQFNTDK
jgi:transposase